MTVTVLPIFETDFIPQGQLVKVMNERLQRLAKELEQPHLKSLSGRGFFSDDLIIYIRYNPKYKIRYQVVNDVPADIDYFVNQVCGRLGYLLWKAPVFDFGDLKSSH